MNRTWLRTLLFAALAVAALSPALAVVSLLADRYDWRYFEALGEISRRTVVWYHQAPLWNPYSCGGEVDLANPQSLDASPTFLLLLLFGTAFGYKLTFCVYHFCALDGTFRLARRLGSSATGATLAAWGYGLSGYLALHFSEGHLTFAGVALFPYLLLGFDRALDESEWIIPTGLTAAWIVLDGGTFTPPMAAELLLLWAMVAAIERRSLRPFALLAGAGGVALAVSAVRMLPVLEFIHDHPRPPFMRALDRSMPWQILGDLIAWREFGPLPGRKYWSHEYAARVPWALLPCVAAAVGALFRRGAARKIGLVLLLGLLLTMGNFSPVAPWSLLQRLPVLKDLRVPSRHLVLVVLGASLLAAMGWDVIAARWPRRARLGIALCVLAALDGTLYTAVQWRKLFTVVREPPDPPVRFYHTEGNWRSMRDVLWAGHGSLGCDEEAPLQRAEALDPGDVPQERLLDPAAGQVVSSDWTPNRRTITLDLQRPTVLLINSNWNEHWKSEVGRVTQVAGRLAVELPAGRQTVTLRYAPRSFAVGSAVSALALPLLLGCFFYRRWRRTSTGS